jgi:hypothetical protein
VLPFEKESTVVAIRGEINAERPSLIAAMGQAGESDILIVSRTRGLLRWTYIERWRDPLAEAAPEVVLPALGRYRDTLRDDVARHAKTPLLKDQAPVLVPLETLAGRNHYCIRLFFLIILFIVCN